MSATSVFKLNLSVMSPIYHKYLKKKEFKKKLMKSLKSIMGGMSFMFILLKMVIERQFIMWK